MLIHRYLIIEITKLLLVLNIDQATYRICRKILFKRAYQIVVAVLIDLVFHLRSYSTSDTFLNFMHSLIHFTGHYVT